MDISTAVMDLGPVDYLVRGELRPADGAPVARLSRTPDPDLLRTIAWEIGERRPADSYLPPDSHVGLAMVHPTQGFAHWRILESWMHDIAGQRGRLWDGSRPVLRLYDVTFIQFNGFNAHRIQDVPLANLFGETFFNLPGPGTWQIAEVGFLLKSGEFIPAARSPVVPFAPDRPSKHGGAAALLVRSPGRAEPIGNVWDQERELYERRRPQLRSPLRLAAFAFASRPSGQEGLLADFVTELASGQKLAGHEVHVFVPATEQLRDDAVIDGVHYHTLEGIPQGDSPVELARAFGRAAEERLAGLPSMDLFHLHEWMTGLGGWVGDRPTVLSLGSLETTRRGKNPPNELSQQIEEVERRLARSVRHVLTPAWLRDRAVVELDIEPDRVHPFALEGRLPNEWERPLDVGQVKMSVGVGPLDRMLLFVGPLEHAAGVDLMIEALPTLLRRSPNLRVAYVGTGPMHDTLHRRAHELGVAYAVRLLGHRSGPELTNLLRAAEALVLPSRFRIAMDDAVVDLARKAGRPVVTTHGGPAHLVRHEENGLVTYDNPGSMVWALDRIMGDPAHAERMGANGRRSEGDTLRWSEVARHYLECCVSWFPELTVTRL